jgi:uncharacterized protein (TIGR02145 family)
MMKCVKNKFWIFPSLAIGLCLLLATSCSKDDDNNSDKTVKDIDGNVYHTVTIGTQTWMVENLKTTKYRNGDPIPNVTNATEWSRLSTGAYCDYVNKPDNSAIYGKLYNWYAVGDSRNIAPAGWHVPTDEEWITLENYLIVNGYNWDGTKEGNKIAKSLASTTGWELFDEAGSIGASPEGNNSTGFTALPGGQRSSGGEFDGVGEYGGWWSSTEYDTSSASGRGLIYFHDYLGRLSTNEECGISVRLVRD